MKNQQNYTFPSKKPRKKKGELLSVCLKYKMRRINAHTRAEKVFIWKVDLLGLKSWLLTLMKMQQEKKIHEAISFPLDSLLKLHHSIHKKVAWKYIFLLKNGTINPVETYIIRLSQPSRTDAISREYIFSFVSGAHINIVLCVIVHIHIHKCCQERVETSWWWCTQCAQMMLPVLNNTFFQRFSS